MKVICSKLKSGECGVYDCSHAVLHELDEKNEEDNTYPIGTGSCHDTSCNTWTDVQCVVITEAETYALRLLYGIRIHGEQRK